MAQPRRLHTGFKMSPPHVTTDSVNDELPEELVEAGVYATVDEGLQHGLVVLAMGSPCWLTPEASQGFRLMVEPSIVIKAREQLACFDRESLRWPPRPANSLAGKPDLTTPLLWSLTLVLVFWGQVTWPEWTKMGALDATAVFHRHEWWRLATALFLHADVDHLISNGLSGILVFAAVLSTFGRVRGWLLICVSGITGNLGVAAINHPAAYRSLGASTAIFAALGLLTGRAVRALAAPGRQRRWREMFVSLAAGLTVLGLYGAGGINVDVIAHVSGFGAGLVLGFCTRPNLVHNER
ncbi:MAG: hypothetical protein RIQ93_536 [Verrucomicrobiota bacterium]|jgi:membrane associated rhomboid family serine protease